jgi:hypothetical protein
MKTCLIVAAALLALVWAVPGMAEEQNATGQAPSMMSNQAEAGHYQGPLARGYGMGMGYGMDYGGQGGHMMDRGMHQGYGQGCGACPGYGMGPGMMGHMGSGMMGPGMMGHMGPGMMAGLGMGGLKGLCKRLELTEEQEKKVRAMATKRAEKMADLWAQRMKLQWKLASLGWGEEIDPQQVREVFAEMAKVQAEAYLAGQEFRRGLEDLLTEKQAEKMGAKG